MALTTAGRNFIAAAITNYGSPTFFTNANSYLGVGDSSTAFDAADTDLKAATNKARKAMDTSYPTTTDNVLVFKSTFATGDANFAWNEWGVFNASSVGTLLCRKVESLGTKSTGTWVLTATITITVGS